MLDPLCGDLFMYCTLDTSSLELSSLQDIIFIPFRLVLVFWRLFKTKERSNGDVIVVQKKILHCMGGATTFFPFLALFQYSGDY